MGAAVFWDFDGTLMHLNPAADALDELRAVVVRLWNEAWKSEPPTRSIFGIYREAYRCDKALADEMSKAIDSFESTLHKTATPVLNHGLLIETLARWNPIDRIGIVTKNGRPLLDRLLSHDALSGVKWSVTITRSEGLDLKPSPEPLEAAVAGWQRGLDDQLIFVGDSATDEECLGLFDARHGGINRFVHIDALSKKTVLGSL